MLKEVLNCRPKFVVFNRNINNVIDSIIKLIDNNPGCIFQGNLDPSSSYEVKRQYQIDMWLKHSINSNHNLKENYKEDCYVIEYNELINNPNNVVNGFYDFFELPRFKHNLYKIENLNQENDMVYGVPGMHNVRPLLYKN